MKIKILYAEDDEFTRKFEIRRLKECGFNVSSVEDGQEANIKKVVMIYYF